MNSCILMAEIIQDPQLRYTSDNQTPIAEMVVQFPGLRDEDPPQSLKVVGWGNLAQEIQEKYHQGDRIVIEGRLTMGTVERPEGFKEKRAELTAQRVHLVMAGGGVASLPPMTANAATSEAATKPRSQTPKASKAPTAVKTTKVEESAASVGAYPTATATPETDYDDIPF